RVARVLVVASRSLLRILRKSLRVLVQPGGGMVEAAVPCRCTARQRHRHERGRQPTGRSRFHHELLLGPWGRNLTFEANGPRCRRVPCYRGTTDAGGAVSSVMGRSR